MFFMYFDNLCYLVASSLMNENFIHIGDVLVLLVLSGTAITQLRCGGNFW